MLKINDKTFMNLQEAVQWLLDNNALPFQSSANYVANAEIGMGTIVNPSPAKVRIGSLIFFADSKVSTVTGLTENGFIVSDQYNNLVDDVAYVTGVSINASGYLITTLSDGQTINAGLIKQIVGLSINGSQHLIATFNDGTTNDLGAIFAGDVDINGNLSAKNFLLPYNSAERYDNDGSAFTFNEITGLTATTFFKHARVSNGKLSLVMAIKVVASTDVVRGSESWLCWGGQFFPPIALNSKLYTSDGTTTSSGSSAVLTTVGGEFAEDLAQPAKTMKAFATITKEGIADEYITLYTRITIPAQTIYEGTYVLRFEVNFIL